MKSVKNFLRRINKGFLAVIAALPLVASIGYVEKRFDDQECRRVIVKVENTLGNYFIEEKDIIKLATRNGARALVGMTVSGVAMKEIENEVKAHRFVKDAQVYKDLKGNLVVNVEQQKPIARIVRNAAPGAYISEDGRILPTSPKYSARTMILRGSYLDRLMKEGLTEQNKGLQLLEMLRYIDGDKYWRAQVAEIEFDEKGSMTIYPQIGKQEFIFGGPEDYEEKLEKINIFYEKIRPLKGWNHYSRVNVKYNNQIICE